MIVVLSLSSFFTAKIDLESSFRVLRIIKVFWKRSGSS